MQFSNSHFGHGLFDSLGVTFPGQTLIWPSMRGPGDSKEPFIKFNVFQKNETCDHFVQTIESKCLPPVITSYHTDCDFKCSPHVSTLQLMSHLIQS